MIRTEGSGARRPGVKSGLWHLGFAWRAPEALVFSSVNPGDYPLGLL